jgi:hypothetical protein
VIGGLRSGLTGKENPPAIAGIAAIIIAVVTISFQSIKAAMMLTFRVIRD